MQSNDLDKPENPVQDRKPIPLKWVFYAILIFALAYHFVVLINHSSN